MKSKIISLFLLTTILTLAVVNAAVLIASTTPASLTKSLTQTNFTITNSGTDAVNIQLTGLPIIFDDGNTHILTLTTPSSLVYNNVLTNQNTGLISFAYSGDATNFKVGEYTKNIIATATSVTNSSITHPLTIPVKFLSTFCKSGEVGTADQTLTISSVDIRNDDGDDTEWTPLDPISVKVKVENTGNNRVSSVYVELGLLDSTGKNVIGNMDNLDNKKISLSSLADSKEKTVEFKFNVPTDFKEGNYNLVIKTYSSGKEDQICSSFSSDLDGRYFQAVSGTREEDIDKHVVVDKIVLSPEETAQCSDTVQASAEVVNIGDVDYLDQFKVTLYNKELGIDLNQVIQEDLDQGDSYTVDFSFNIPAKAAEKSYDLEFKTYYDYDDSGSGSYSEISSKKFTKTIKVLGNCQAATPTTPASQLKISAQLDPQTPEASAGKQVIIQATLKNTGTTDTTYTLSIYGNSAWSSLVSIDPQTITLSPGQSKDASIVLNVDSAAQGDKEFIIRAAYGTAGDKAVEQKVSLSVVKAQSTDYQSVVNHFKNNWFIYLIVLVNLILIIAIIAVIRRMVSSPREGYQ
ncbi:MAG: putative S-layer protein [Nanoarchaeota archaeon]